MNLVRKRKIINLCVWVNVEKKKLIVKLKRKKDINVISPEHLLCTYTRFFILYASTRAVFGVEVTSSTHIKRSVRVVGSPSAPTFSPL